MALENLHWFEVCNVPNFTTFSVSAKNGTKNCDVLIFTASFAEFLYLLHLYVNGNICGAKTQKNKDIRKSRKTRSWPNKLGQSRKTGIAGQPE